MKTNFEVYCLSCNKKSISPARKFYPFHCEFCGNASMTFNVDDLKELKREIKKLN